MPDLPEFPDALFVPSGVLRGRHTLQMVHAAADVVEPLLGVDPLKREKAWMRGMNNGKLFCTKSPHDTVYFPKDHPTPGLDRYHWVEKENGVEYGYLMEDARA